MDPGDAVPMSTPDPLGNLFARLRDAVDEPDEPGEPDEVDAPGGALPATGPPEERVPAPHPAPQEAPDEAEFVIVAVDLVSVEPAEPEPHWPVFAVAESATLDDAALRRRRDASVSTALAALAPRIKRLLQDDQNELLDAIRRQKGKGDPIATLGTEAETVARWVEVVGPALDECYAAGRTLGGGRTRPAPPALVEQLVALVVAPLRERVTASLEGVLAGGPYDGPADLQRAVAGAVGARYREWRAQDLEAALGDLAAWTFARGVFDATPEGVLLRWVPAEVEQCPDADDNALEPTARGCPFPTGQSCPPAHLGCRCLVVPASGADGRAPTGGH